MDHTATVALISSGGSILVAITALVLNYRGFASIDGRFASLEARMLTFETKVDSRLNMMQSDMRDLNKTMTALEINVAILKDKTGIESFRTAAQKKTRTDNRRTAPFDLPSRGSAGPRCLSRYAAPVKFRTSDAFRNSSRFSG